MTRPLLQLDVFGSGPFSGNPLAVVLDAEGLSDEQMQRFATWTNLSECTFVLPPTTPDADYRVRIFTTERELPFAGHPTLGTARAWLEAGGVPQRAAAIVQECGAGLVRVRQDGEDLAFAAPPLVRSGPVDDAHLDGVGAILGIRPDDVVDAAWIDNGPGWVGVLLSDAEAVLALRPSPAAGSWDIGVAGLHADGGLEVRAFIVSGGTVVEDPVTGSLNASLAQWLTGSGRLSTPYTARQGTAIGRRGTVRVTAEGEDLWIGGATRVAIRGTVDL